MVKRKRSRLHKTLHADASLCKAAIAQRKIA